MPAIVVEGLTKTYEKPVLQGINLEVPTGSCIALLGPNGAGKTTTVEILESFRHRDGGRVEVLGVDPACPTSAWRAKIGIVLQASTDNAQLTCREVLHSFAALYPTARPTDEVLKLVGLTDHADRRARHLSGGQRRRLDVALGIIGRPEVLFLDEPTIGFDAEARRQFWQMIKDLRGAEGTTIVLTTHYLDEAEELADDVAIIAGGVIRAQGPPATIGGRNDALALVRFRLTDGRLIERESALPALVASLSAEHGELTDLTVTRPSLEDVYLSLIHEEVLGS